MQLFFSFPLSPQTSTPPLYSHSHSHCRSMSEDLSDRLDHSQPRTRYELSRVPMKEVVDLMGKDSDDDLSYVFNQDGHAIALELRHQMQPQRVKWGSIPRGE